MKSLRLLAGVGIAVVLAMTRPAVHAQGTVIGTFRWQLQPHCNVVTVTITQTGAIYHVDGTDDQCGGSRVSSVVGLAFPNPNGTIGFGFTTVTVPGGVALHTDATITLGTLSGNWQDSAGQSGTFTLTPGAGTGGAPRPAPPGGIGTGVITAAQIADGTITAAKIAPGVIPAGGVADGSVTTAKLADGAVTAAKIANATITGAKLAPGALALSCVTTANSVVSNIAPGGTVNVTAPGCAAGYVQTSTNCEASSWLMPFVFVNGGTCSARNNDAIANELRASRTCCRVQ